MAFGCSHLSFSLCVHWIPLRVLYPDTRTQMYSSRRFQTPLSGNYIRHVPRRRAQLHSAFWVFIFIFYFLFWLTGLGRCLKALRRLVVSITINFPDPSLPFFGLLGLFYFFTLMASASRIHTTERLKWLLPTCRTQTSKIDMR